MRMTCTMRSSVVMRFYTPMIEHDDYYMLSNSFEVASYTFESPYNTSLHAGYFYKNGRCLGQWR